MTKNEYRNAQKKAAGMIRQAGIEISEKEAENIEVVDFGLGDLKREGAQILTLVHTERLSIKVIALFPNQIEPEHWHLPVDADPGKEETIRIVKGILYLFLPGPSTLSIGQLPENREHEFTCKNEIIMNVNEQITVVPGTKHWFKAGNEGAVIYSYSTVAYDSLDKFTNPRVKRITIIEDEEL